MHIGCRILFFSNICSRAMSISQGLRIKGKKWKLYSKPKTLCHCWSSLQSAHSSSPSLCLMTNDELQSEEAEKSLAFSFSGGPGATKILIAYQMLTPTRR